MEGNMVKVRFAPSPTGYLHVGNAKTALLNYLFVRKNGGIMVLRMEDTDTERSDAKHERSIIDDLRWLGVTWDKGPCRQSERIEIYRSHAKNLLESGHAYKCYCTEEDLATARQNSLARGKPPRYHGKCRGLSDNEAIELEKRGKVPVIRFRSPERPVTFHDEIRGKLAFPRDHVDDLILLRQDGTPTYNLAAVVDDMLMDITHVIRGGDHISNTPKQISLFEAFGKIPPRYGHHSLLIGADKKPLSKRHGTTRVVDFRAMGVVSAALVNYLCTMGRNIGKEIMELDELANTFSLGSLSRNDSIFDIEKLIWFNKEYIKRMPLERLLHESDLPVLVAERARVVRENASTLNDIRDYLTMFESAGLTEKALLYLTKVVGTREMGRTIEGLLLAEKKPSLEDLSGALDPIESIKRKDLYMVLRAFITGRTDGPPLKDVFPLMSVDIMLQRVQSYLNRWEKNGV